MLAYVEIGADFFEGVCPPGSATAYLYDPPPAAPRFANRLVRVSISQRSDSGAGSILSIVGMASQEFTNGW